MEFYHCSPVGGLTVLEPREPEAFDKPARVYMTTLVPMALMYSVRNFEYTYGYTKEGQIYFEEYFPNAMEILYRGKTASLYLCMPEHKDTTPIPNEVVSELPVPILRETIIPDAMEALLEQERLGALVIRRYDVLTSREREWIRKAEMQTILEKGLLDKDDAFAAYMKAHYPDSWELAMEMRTLRGGA